MCRGIQCDITFGEMLGAVAVVDDAFCWAAATLICRLAVYAKLPTEWDPEAGPVMVGLASPV